MEGALCPKARGEMPYGQVHRTRAPRRRLSMAHALWIVQVLLALVFLFAGGVKLVVPFEELAAGMPIALPEWFVRFIGVAEVLGALGLILPGLVRIRPGLTPLAA